MLQRVSTKRNGIEQFSLPRYRFWPALILFTMVSSLFVLDAVLPLRYVGLPDALLTHLGTWPLWPAHILFSQLEVVQQAVNKNIPYPIAIELGWKETALLFGAFMFVLLSYVFALRNVVRFVTFRYIFISTTLLGMLCVICAIVPSGDIFSYIAYARMGVIYHLNPLVAFPSQISHDSVFPYLYWIDQPSIYGPTWIILTSIMEWILLKCGFPGLVSMILLLRLLGLVMHLGSVLLIWSMSGQLQRLNGHISTEKRVFATLAFAWNPLLLLEACANGHVDATALFLVLLALWFLLKGHATKHALLAQIPVAIFFAIAVCLKLNIGLLVLGLLLYLWFQQDNIRKLLVFSGTVLGAIVLLYAPFWQNGKLLHTILGTPATDRNINTLPDFFSNLINGIVYFSEHRSITHSRTRPYPLPHPNIHLHAPHHLHIKIHPHPIIQTLNHTSVYIVSSVDRSSHLISMSIFLILLMYLCWWVIRVPERINNVPALIRWIALVWLLYCMVGTPWFWPWYLVTFFGLFALVEATTDHQTWVPGVLHLPLLARLLTFSALTLYCFSSWAALNSFVPGLFYFYWSDFRGLSMWLIPLIGVIFSFLKHSRAKASETNPGFRRWKGRAWRRQRPARIFDK